MSKVHESLIAARLAGHSWDTIHEHYATQIDNGFTREELGFAPTDNLMNQMRAQHVDAIAGEVQNPHYILTAAAASNENSPFAWVQGRAPRGVEMQGYAGGTRTPVPPTSIGVTSIGGGKWKALSGDTMSGNLGKATEADKYNMAAKAQKAANSRDPEHAHIEDLHEQRPFTDTEMKEMNSGLEEKKQFIDGANRTTRDIEGAMTGASPNVNKGVDAVADDVKLNLRGTAISTTDEQN